MDPNPNPNPNLFDSPPPDHVPEIHDSLDVPNMSSNAQPTQPKSIPPESPSAEVQVHHLRGDADADADADASVCGPGPGARTDSDASDASKTRQHAAATLIQAAKEEHSYTPLTAIRKYWRAFVWCMFMNIGALLWGYDAQIGGATLSVPSFRRDFGYTYDGQYVLPASWQSAFNSVSSIGGMFGGLSLGIVAERFGRRGATALASFVSITAIFIQFFTPPHANGMLLVGKLINGYALGMYVSSASSYCAEISPLALRGITTGSVNLWIVIGQFLSNCVIEGCGTRTDQYAYRIPFAIQWIFPTLLLIGLPFAPESPWWLVRRGRFSSAEHIVSRLGGPTVDAPLFVHQIQDTIALEDLHRASSTYLDCARGSDRRRTIIAMMVFVLQQVAGVVFVLGFSNYFFQLAGFNTANSFKLGVGVTAIGIVGNLVAFFAVNRFGRRPLFFWGMIGCAAVNLAVGFSSLANTQAARWSEAAFTIIYNFVYQVGIGPLGYVIFAEVGSAKLRSKTVGIGIFVNSLCGMIANIVIPYLVNPDEANLGGKVGFIFGGLGLIGSVWAWVYIPETKYRTVDELDALFEARISPRKFHKTDVGALTGRV
ncbi:hypothetical protein EHS25_009331 [Saitozyma podzolica]|uniref:Major facilitator superfamily (MFS) profile domain-containing protein n=1 Tax=Saitozyma podzolica TaxID=1890683 RepID=A0A427YLN3_9TREE|nr:hypothetical protein EHS25_009331 [Saitozyma podzolica]